MQISHANLYKRMQRERESERNRSGKNWRRSLSSHIDELRTGVTAAFNWVINRPGEWKRRWKTWRQLRGRRVEHNSERIIERKSGRMSMFSYIKVIALAIVAILIAIGLYYVSNMQANLAIAKENQKKLETAVEAQKEAMAVMKADVAKQQKINDQLAKVAESQKKDMKALENKFKVDSKGEKRSIAEIAIQKPNLMEEKVNRGSANAVRCLEIASGAPLTEKEKNAKTAKEFNSECPAFFNPVN